MGEGRSTKLLPFSEAEFQIRYLRNHLWGRWQPEVTLRAWIPRKSRSTSVGSLKEHILVEFYHESLSSLSTAFMTLIQFSVL